MNTPLRSVRIPNEIWDPAKARAKELGIPLTAVVVTALVEFLEAEECLR